MKTYDSIPKPSTAQLRSNRSFILSNREKEIIQLIAAGWGTKQIASQLWISNHTVDTHRKNLIRKTESKNTIEMVVTCMRRGFLS